MSDALPPGNSLPVTFRDAVRYRPATYIGGVDTHAANRLVSEVVSGCLAKVFKSINVAIQADLEVRFECTKRIAPNDPDGMEPLQQYDGTNLQSFLIKDGNYLPVLNALSREFEIEIIDGGAARLQRFQDGMPLKKTRSKGADAADMSDQCKIIACLDPAIFDFAWFRQDLLSADFAALGSQVPGLKIKLTDERTNPNPHRERE